MERDNENKRYDCSRGCIITGENTSQPQADYRHGCCKLEVYDWLKGVSQQDCKDLFEVRFKNTRKGFIAMLPVRRSRSAILSLWKQ